MQLVPWSAIDPRPCRERLSDTQRDVVLSDFYCPLPSCDCRRVILVARDTVNLTQLAVVEHFFTRAVADGMPMTGLSRAHEQGPDAAFRLAQIIDVLGRDHERAGEYERRYWAVKALSIDPDAPAHDRVRAAAIVAERDARLRDVELRYTPKVDAAPVAMVCARLPVVRVRVRVRRRKAERELRVTLPAGAQALDHLACELCGGVTPRPAVCDDRLHVACERCVPQAQGRFACAACAKAK